MYSEPRTYWLHARSAEWDIPTIKVWRTLEACRNWDAQFTLEQNCDWDLGNAHIGPLRGFSRVVFTIQ